MWNIPSGLRVTDINILMRITRSSRFWIVTGIIGLITAAFIAAVFLGFIFLPGYSKPSDRTVSDTDQGITVTETGRKLTVSLNDKEIWSLPEEVRAQDFLYDDIDGDGRKDLIVLCWKRGRYGKHRPTWVEHDEISWSQHIYIYRIEDDRVIPKWMASDIGVDAASWEYQNGLLYITDTEGNVTKWKWIHRGLEKM